MNVCRQLSPLRREILRENRGARSQALYLEQLVLGIALCSLLRSYVCHAWSFWLLGSVAVPIVH